MRSLRLMLVMCAFLVAPSAAVAQQVCTVPGPEAAAEKRLQGIISERKGYGFRSDRAYVESLLAQGLTAGPDYALPVTAAERRYLKRREALRLGAAATRYLRNHPEFSGWWEVRDDWPRGAYVAVYVADDPAKHRATIMRRAAFPRATRVVRIRYSDRERDRVANRIGRDFSALRRAGFTVLKTWSDTGTDRIDVHVVTRRTDAASYFAKRYERLVRTVVVGTELTKPGCIPIDVYQIAPDGMSLTVRWSNKPQLVRVELTELPDRVALGVVVRVPSGGYGDLVLRPGGSTVVQLSAPLGSRPVYDADNGSRILPIGPFPGDPPCPVAVQSTPLEQAIAERTRYGMNTDPAYVQTLMGRPRPFTDAEQRWIDLVIDLEAQPGFDQYMFHWAKDWGGTTVVADYPAKPYILVRFLRRRAFHERRIKALAKYPDLLRTVRSTVQRDWFDELADVIDRDAVDRFIDGYGRDGFYIAASLGDESTQSVEVSLITTRTDAAEYFTRRYGPLVKVKILGDRFECRGSYPEF